MNVMDPHHQLLLLDEPYVSPFLRETIASHGLPVVFTETARRMGMNLGLEEEDAAERARNSENLAILTVSENSIDWINRRLPDHVLTSWVQDFKDKARFRTLTRSVYPELFYREVSLEEIDHLDLVDLPLPFIIKPSVGFFSLGVHRVSNGEEWMATRRAMHRAIDELGNLFPEEVLNLRSWLIEEWIEGEELAIDAYFDGQGKTVVLGVWRHAFASDADTSDRVYSTSRDIVAADLQAIQQCLDRIGAVTGARDFPFHVELRRTHHGFVPIEVNPLRFGGWCTTADLAAHAYGFNPYLSFFRREEPDWPEILENMGDSVHSIVVLDNSTGFAAPDIASFDYDGLTDRFSSLVELRKIDYRRYPLFGFLFLETPGQHESELDWILGSDLAEFVVPKS